MTRIKCLQFQYHPARYLLSRLTYSWLRRLWSSRLPALRLRQIEKPVANRSGWTVLKVILSGICGSDVNVMTGQESLFLEPEATYPFVPGHEFVGEVECDLRVIREGQPIDLPAGQRVAVCPVLGCEARGLSPGCEPCSNGWTGFCRRRDANWPDHGLSIGYNRDTGGGWSEQCLAHTSQLWPLPESVHEADAVLLDPAAAALAALLRTDDPPPGRTLIIGGGTIGLLAAWLHSQLGLAGGCELLVRHEFQKRWALERGLTASVVRSEREFCQWAGERSISMTRILGYGPVFQGCYDRIIDAAGTRSSLQWSIRCVRPGGLIALLSASSNLRGIDFTPVWYREINLQGVFQYGPVAWNGNLVHPYEVLIPRLADGTLRLRELITHEFPLDDYLTALDSAVRRSSSQAIKVTFRPSGLTSNSPTLA